MRASGQLDGRFLPSAVTDGIIQEAKPYEGYWLLPNSVPGWIEIDFSGGAEDE